MESFLNVILALLVLSVIIVFHEFGHFIFARINGVEVIEFSLGMGPKIVSKTIKGTIFSWRLLPIGGACMMKGEDSSDKSEGTFNSKGVWQRISIVLAGPVFNFILAFLLGIIIIVFVGFDKPYVTELKENSVISNSKLLPGDLITKFDGKSIKTGRDLYNYEYFNDFTENDINVEVIRDGEKLSFSIPTDAETKYFMGIKYVADDEPAEISEIQKDLPADNCGMHDGDIITSINDFKITSGKELGEYFENHPLTEDSIEIIYERNGKSHNCTLTPMWNTYYSVGFYFNMAREEVKPSAVLGNALTEMRYWITTTIDSLKALITGRVGTDQMGGAVRVVGEISESVQESKSISFKMMLLNLVYWSIVISANLGVMNLLPIPALDGGRLLFLFLEVIRRKPISPDKEAIVHFIGFALLMLLMVFLLYNDIVNMFF